MRRDIIAGCIGLSITALFFIYNKRKSHYKPIEYVPYFFKTDFSETETKIITIHPASDMIFSQESTFPKQKSMYTIPEANNIDMTDIDELMQLPLETGSEILKEEASLVPNTLFTKYVRFQITEVRDSHRVCVGGFSFLYNNVHIPFKKIQLWNPHTGESGKYGGGAWTDSDQMSIVFYFSEPVEITQYAIKSSHESEEYDPIQWKVEGSMNGSFWVILDDRTISSTAFPKERNKIALYLMRP
jgi:hypothetical protein